MEVGLCPVGKVETGEEDISPVAGEMAKLTTVPVEEPGPVLLFRTKRCPPPFEKRSWTGVPPVAAVLVPL